MGGDGVVVVGGKIQRATVSNLQVRRLISKGGRRRDINNTLDSNEVNIQSGGGIRMVLRSRGGNFRKGVKTLKEDKYIENIQLKLKADGGRGRLYEGKFWTRHLAMKQLESNFQSVRYVIQGDKVKCEKTIKLIESDLVKHEDGRPQGSILSLCNLDKFMEKLKAEYQREKIRGGSFN